MKKLLSLTVLLILMIVILTGCVTVDYKVTVNKDGSGQISYVYGFEKSFLEQMEVSIEDMTSDMKQSAEEKEYLVETYADDRVEGFRATKEVEDITTGISLSEAFGETNVKDSEGNNINIEKGIFGVQYSQKGTIDLTGMGDMSTYGVVLRYSINLPVKAGDNNANEVSEDGKTLTWELKGGEENSIEFTANGPSTVMNILILVGILVVAGAAIAIVLVILKRVNNSTSVKESSDNSINTEETLEDEALEIEKELEIEEDVENEEKEDE